LDTSLKDGDFIGLETSTGRNLNLFAPVRIADAIKTGNILNGPASAIASTLGDKLGDKAPNWLKPVDGKMSKTFWIIAGLIVLAISGTVVFFLVRAKKIKLPKFLGFLGSKRRRRRSY
jgi:hypothetical protein